jgi:GNAT superfamily N-acetyltransferase
VTAIISAGSNAPAVAVAPLASAHDPNILKAIQANHYGYFAFVGQLPQVDFHVEPDAIWYASDVPHGPQNRVFQARFAPAQADARIEALLACYRTRGVPMLWWLWEDSQPADLGRRLLAHGLKRTRTSEGMAADLTTLNEGFACAPATRIEPVRTPAQLRQFVEVIGVGFDAPRVATEALYDQFLALGLDGRLPLRHYLALLEDEPVASSTMFLGGGVAGLYAVTTVPKARRQGIATAVTLAPLRAARDEGYRVGVLLPSSAGFQVYLRLGFFACCNLDVFALDGP